MDQEEQVEQEGTVETPEAVKTIEEQLEEEKAKAERYLNNWRRAEADFDNYKKRIEQDRADSSKYANVQVIMSLLPVLDDFERALSNIPKEVARQGWVEGIQLIYRKLKGLLNQWNVKEIKALGETFNPAVHEAVMQTEGEEGKVVTEIQKGYKMHDRVIRPSLVAVGKGRG